MSRPDLDFAVEAFCRELNAEGSSFKCERGPKGSWLFHSDETISLTNALKAAIKAARERAAA